MALKQPQGKASVPPLGTRVRLGGFCMSSRRGRKSPNNRHFPEKKDRDVSWRKTASLEATEPGGIIGKKISRNQVVEGEGVWCESLGFGTLTGEKFTLSASWLRGVS